MKCLTDGSCPCATHITDARTIRDNHGHLTGFEVILPNGEARRVSRAKYTLGRLIGWISLAGRQIKVDLKVAL